MFVCEREIRSDEMPPLAIAVWATSRWTAGTGMPLLLEPRLLRGSDGTRYKRFVLPNTAVGVVKFSVLVLAACYVRINVVDIRRVKGGAIPRKSTHV